MLSGYNFHLLLADSLLAFHITFVLFIAIGFILTWLGYFLHWSFVRNFTFRLVHLLCMGYVAWESVTGIYCPLTLWEDELRHLGGVTHTYQGTFMQHWFHQFLFVDLPFEVLTYVYTTFFLVLLVTFWVVRPNWPSWLRRKRIKKA